MHVCVQCPYQRHQRPPGCLLVALARAGQAYQLCVLSNERCISVRAFDVEGARGFDGGADVREEGEEKEEAVGWREGGCGEEHGPRARGTPKVVRFGSTPGVT